MKRPFVIYLFLLVSCMTVAQENAYKSVSNYGKYINRDGEYLELPDDVYPEKEFQDGYVSIRYPSNGKNFSIINHEGEIVGNPGDGVDRINDGRLFVAKRNGLYGYRNRSSEIVITPTFEKAEPFNDDYALVVKDGLESIINRSGEIVFTIESLKIKYGNNIAISSPHFSPIDFFLGLRQFGGLLEMLEASNRVY
jgi:hypothetical protein